MTKHSGKSLFFGWFSLSAIACGIYGLVWLANKTLAQLTGVNEACQKVAKLAEKWT